jgi:hypothetical protein
LVLYHPVVVVASLRGEAVQIMIREAVDGACGVLEGSSSTAVYEGTVTLPVALSMDSD